MTVDFSEHFWGPKNNGFEVLYQNMKHGFTTSKDLADFFKERSSVEEGHSKSLTKLAKIASNASPQGTFAPVWQILKTSTEKLSTIHSQLVQRIQELVKDLGKYSDELQKKHKLVKEEETGTQETVQIIQNTSVSLQKTKEVYLQRVAELEKLQKDNGSQKDIEKAEVKAKKAYEEYKVCVDKYTLCRDDFERKMTLACKHFQEVEVSHLLQLNVFLEQYATMLENNNALVGEVHGEFRKQVSELTVESLLEQFVQSKATGPEKPEVIEIDEEVTADFVSRVSGGSEEKSSLSGGGDKKREGNGEQVEEVKASKGSRRTTSLLNLFIPLSQGSRSKGNDSPNLDLPSDLGQSNSANPNNKSTLARTTNRGSKWDSPTRSPYSSISSWTAGFLRSRRDKKKEKKAKNKKKDDNLSAKDEKSDQEDKDDTLKSTPSAEIDEEGYTVRPKQASGQDKNSFYSSSDSDSGDEGEKRLHIEIKPLGNGSTPFSASVDELRSTVENMTLSPVGLVNRKLLHDGDSQMKRSQSVSQQLGNSPPSRHRYAPLSSPPHLHKTGVMPTHNETSKYSDLGDIFSELGDIQPTLPAKAGAQRNTPTPTSGLVAIPRPPSRPRPDGVLQRNLSSPSQSMSRTESIGSLETRSIGSRVLSSRGPSPLTIGLADSIPLAVAFHEIVHACFKGTDENQCQVKMTGDMMVSFPAGIIQVFATNPLPAQLSCRVRSSQLLDNLVPNKELVNVTKGVEEITFDFNMGALVQFLKEQAEHNPHASFFNVDILKYNIIPKSGAGSCPLHLVAFWKCEPSRTDLKIEYKYNSRAMFPVQSIIPNATPTNHFTELPQLVNVQVAAPVDGGVKTMQSKPGGQWLPETNRACWKIPSLSHQSDKGIRSLLARFEVSNGPSSPGTIAAQFSCECSTLSGCDFQLTGSGYRVSLIKKRFVSGKYTCDSDDSGGRRYAVPPNSIHA